MNDISEVVRSIVLGPMGLSYKWTRIGSNGLMVEIFNCMECVDYGRLSRQLYYFSNWRPADLDDCVYYGIDSGEAGGDCTVSNCTISIRNQVREFVDNGDNLGIFWTDRG